MLTGLFSSWKNAAGSFLVHRHAPAAIFRCLAVDGREEHLAQLESQWPHLTIGNLTMIDFRDGNKLDTGTHKEDLVCKKQFRSIDGPLVHLHA